MSCLPRKVPRRHAATNGDQARRQTPKCHAVPRLPRKTKVDVAKCHACHVKRRWMSPSAMPATQSATASRASQRGPSATQVPGLPCNTKVDVAKCHACHVKPRWMSPKCHACHVKRRWTSPSDQRCHVKRQPASRKQPNLPPSAPPECHVRLSATPATQNEGGCRQVPRLPRKTKVDVTKCHACRRNGGCASLASPATKVARCPSTNAPPEPAQCPKCHACHAKTFAGMSAKCQACHVKMGVDKVVCERWCVTKMCA